MTDATHHWPPPIRLVSGDIAIEPLALHHASGLATASADGDLSDLWYTAVPSPTAMTEAIAARLAAQAAGQSMPFAVVLQGRAVGMTSYLNLVPGVKRLEIGSTWYARSVQRTGVNTRCKLLLLEHAFEVLGCIAVEFRTHFFNRQSRTAIEGLGAKLDGVLRNHHDPAGNIRDTCVYSVIAGEWPFVKRHLEFQLARHRP